ncbi:AMP-binding protein [Pseudogemmatithrix spongiicola]|uniref:AMP-binding protein n=1 Tax=Pseudogemmatithrix spongiicola TaxID=3062599 RepID=A0AA49JTM7_9BACT|nr:AMP-binding protein [Gemmatimonadaceae bacterium 'strain 138']WKW14631.1 AMP-binding protein [Gemmatimonadaceae bacterium 'strain 318']
MTTMAAPVSAALRTLPARVLHWARVKPGRLALRHRELGLWREYSWREYAERVAQTGLGLRALGVGAGDRVAIIGDNRPEWLFADLGVQGIGAVVVGVYATSPAEEVHYVLEHSGSAVVIVEDEEQLDKVLAVRDRLPALRDVILIEPRGAAHHLADGRAMTFEALLARGAAAPVTEFEASVASLDPSDAAVLIYTSGTTGAPKGAILSHANLDFTARTIADAFDADEDDETLSYLPLCHIAEQIFSLLAPLEKGSVVSFGGGVDELVADLREIQPTIFFGVPRVWEKMLAGIEIRMNDASWLKKRNFHLWMGVGRRLARKRIDRVPLTPLDRALEWLGWLLLYRPLRERLGMARVRYASSAAAPVAPQVIEAFWSLGVRIREAYGQTEGCGLATFTPEHDVRPGLVGTAFPGVELRIAEDGEILVRGACVFAGYYRNEAATRETVDADGWLHTGDVGELSPDGFLRITDRKKDLIITSGGKNIAPSWIENKLKVSPFVREAIVIGDRRKYCTALIGIEMDTVADWATRRRISYTTYEDLSAQPEVKELIAAWIEQVNADLAPVEQIKRFAMIPKPLDHEEGELTATQKVKRRAIEKAFSDLIAGMYA